jgi:intergrase/recombinase
MRLEVRAKWPSAKGLGFRKTLQQSNQRVSLFFITTDSSVHVRLQAPRQQFESLGLETKIVENFGARVKEILNGFTAPIEKLDTEAFKKALEEFITDLDQEEEK